ncbi:MAG: DUF6785 family protein [Armatimonadia bacterium]
MAVAESIPSGEDNPQLQPVSLRTLLVALIITVFGLFFYARSSLNGLGAGVPLALAVLGGLVALEPVLRRWLKLTRADIIVIYCFVLIASHSYQLVDRFLPAYTVPLYFAAPENNFEQLADEYVPSWFVPKDREVIRTYFEGADGPFSLRPWVLPLSLWTLFFMTMWGTLYCLTAILRRHWVEHERLSFPLVTVPLYIASAGSGRLRPRTVIWREPLMWVGFAISSVHFLTIMLHASNPSIPTLGTNYDVGKLFTEKPLDALRPLFLFVYNPTLTGLAYFAPQDLSFSMWFFFIFYFKPLALFYRLSGLQTPSGFPYYWEQSAGAFVAIAVFYAWAGRGYLKRVALAAWNGTWLTGEDPRNKWADPLSYRLAVGGLICGFVAMCLWYVLAGMTPWVTALFFFLIILFAVIFTRGRAETGVASTASYPFWQASRQIKSFLGSGPLVYGGSLSNLVMLGSLIYLHFGDYPEGMTYQVESLKLGEESRVKTSHMTWIIIGSMLVGLLVHYYVFLTMSYEWGNNTLGGGTTQGGYGVSIARSEWMEVSKVADGNPLRPDWNRNGFTLAAFLITLLLVFIRVKVPRSPFHPLGFVMTMSYGYAYWGSFFTIWLVKAIILRLGGVRMYHKLTPVFVGLVMGQIFMLSLIWPLWAMFSPEEWKTLADPLIYF